MRFNIDFLRNMNQDGLEIFFGGVKTNCHNAKSPIPIHFKSAYITTILNNLTSSNSMKSNCEKDNSTSLLNNFDRIVLKGTNQVLGTASERPIDSCNEQDPLDLILFDPQLPEIDVVETEVLTFISSLICDDLLKDIDCELCINSLQTVSKGSVHDILSSNLSYPSETFISNLKKVWYGMAGLLPNLCVAIPLKKTLVSNVNNIRIIYRMGCRKHNKYIKKILLNITAVHAIKAFCTTINDLLSNKTKVLPEHCKGIQIYEVAFAFRKKRRTLENFLTFLKKYEFLKFLFFFLNIFIRKILILTLL